jgi:valyl-tRNA synthetase
MRFDCRDNILESLKQKGLHRGKEPNKMRLGFCGKSGDVIEPFLKPQWYADCKQLAERSCEAVRNKELIIMPEEHERTWFDWLEKI